MNLICSPKGIIDIERPGQGLGDMVRAGFEYISLDLSIFWGEYDLENIGKSSLNRIARQRVERKPEELYSLATAFVERCARENLRFPIAMTPRLLRNTKHTDLTPILLALAKESIRVCQRIGCNHLVVRPLFAGISDSDLWEQNRAFYLELADYAKGTEVQILLENQCKDLNGHLLRGVCADAVQATAWIDELNQVIGGERFGFCMDVGVCNLCGQNMYDFIVTLGERIKAVILRDCNGTREASLLPFTSVAECQSQTDWLNLFRGLRKVAFDGNLVLDFVDTACAFSPILKPQLMSLAKATGEFFQWQIELERKLGQHKSRVLFGAGNMCRNYMKCYGAQYPPLYTCDNNSSIWGTEFEGLVVKSPECLRELPEDTAIYICNVYYREIEKQLRDMGLKNPIEFFNDEYMPTFHFDRIDAKTRRSKQEK